MSERFHRRHLPHYDSSHATYFVTACLAGSIPAAGLLHMRRQSEMLALVPRPADMTQQDWDRQRQARLFDDGEEWLDTRPAAKWFQDRRLATIMRSAIMFHAGKTCDVHAYVIMPSHLHLIFTPYAKLQHTDESKTIADIRTSPRSAIMHSIKLFTALRCNRVLGRKGAFWQSESYDRVVRNSEELERFVQYVECNPVKAGLCQRSEDWEFSSAAAGRL